MVNCKQCGKYSAARAIGLCVECLRTESNASNLVELHIPFRKKFGLTVQPPVDQNGIQCNFCSNICQIGEGETGYCSIRRNKEGRLVNIAREGSALAYMYLDRLPTNCCSAWFCNGSCEQGYNLAVFFYGCNFDCLFCQNPSHKRIDNAESITEVEMVQAALDPKVRCVCFFGGSPEPQLPFTLSVSQRILKESNNQKHICWEWNGCGNPNLVTRAAELAEETGGTIKFDLKTFNPNLSYALCGVNNRRAFENFALIAKSITRKNLLTSTTLLVPFYVDQQEVEQIARFISEINPQIPYSLLVFHPDLFLNDLPITPRKQVDECYQIAKQYLTNVIIGNRHLL